MSISNIEFSEISDIGSKVFNEDNRNFEIYVNDYDDKNINITRYILGNSSIKELEKSFEIIMIYKKNNEKISFTSNEINIYINYEKILEHLINDSIDYGFHISLLKNIYSDKYYIDYDEGNTYNLNCSIEYFNDPYDFGYKDLKFELTKDDMYILLTSIIEIIN